MTLDRDLAPTLFKGKDAALHLARFLEGKRVALVHGHSYSENPIRSSVEQVLKSDFVRSYGEWQELPTSDDVRALSRALRSGEPEVVLAVGGGSILDLAKEARRNGSPQSLLVAVPTTAGSGSEATPYASILTRQQGRWAKVSQTWGENIPSLAILDPIAIRELPLRQRVISSVDALSQSIESLWSTRSTENSRAMSVCAIRLLTSHMEAFQKGCNDNLEEMLYGAHLSGRAIALAPTNLCHAVSYPLTSIFRIPHGWAVGFTLSKAILWNAPVLCELGEALSQSSGFSDLTKLADWIEHIRVQSGLSCRLSDWGVREQDLAQIVTGSYRADRMSLAPRAIAQDQLYSMLSERL